MELYKFVRKLTAFRYNIGALKLGYTVFLLFTLGWLFYNEPKSGIWSLWLEIIIKTYYYIVGQKFDCGQT